MLKQIKIVSPSKCPLPHIKECTYEFKPGVNLIVGPNGSGKSALVRSLAIAMLAFDLGKTTIHRKAYSDYGHYKHCYSKSETSWKEKYNWCAGMEMQIDLAPVYFYRPDYIPGDETSVAHAMMTGFFDEAREYAQATEHKSSGQKCQAILNEMLGILRGEIDPHYEIPLITNEQLEELEKQRLHPPSDFKAAVHRWFKKLKPGNIPVLIFDEPEQSLDLNAQIKFWQMIKNAPSTIQVIVVTHSLVPIITEMYRSWNVIEMQDGWVDELWTGYTELAS